MSDAYAAYETVLTIALPQIHSMRTGGSEWTRTIQVTKDAAQDFIITRTKVLVSPTVLQQSNGKFDVANFCFRISREVTEFDTRAEREGEAIRAEWQEKLNRAVCEIARRYEPGTLREMILEAMEHCE